MLDIIERNEQFRRLAMTKNLLEYKLLVKREGEWEDPVMRSTDQDYLIETGQKWLDLKMCKAFRVTLVDTYAIDVVG